MITYIPYFKLLFPQNLLLFMIDSHAEAHCGGANKIPTRLGNHIPSPWESNSQPLGKIPKRRQIFTNRENWFCRKGKGRQILFQTKW